MNNLFDEEIQGHHSMRDLLLTVLSDADLEYELPGANPPLGAVLIELGNTQGVYTSSLETSALDWDHRRLQAPERLTIASLQEWFAAQDTAMKAALDRFTDEQLHEERIDRGGGFLASPFVQHEIYREAVYIFYGRLSVYLRALNKDAGPDWTAWVG